jgi:hypothetical protein
MTPATHWEEISIKSRQLFDSHERRIARKINMVFVRDVSVFPSERQEMSAVLVTMRKEAREASRTIEDRRRRRREQLQARGGEVDEKVLAAAAAAASRDDRVSASSMGALSTRLTLSYLDSVGIAGGGGGGVDGMGEEDLAVEETGRSSERVDV